MIKIVILFLLISSIVCKICCSKSLSKKEVASSKIIIFGCPSIALAIDTLCLCEDNNLFPFTPTLYSYLSIFFSIKSLIKASLHTFSNISSKFPFCLNVSSLPKIILCFIDLLNKKWSCFTNPIKSLKYSKLYSLIFIPSNNISPSVGSYNLSIKLIVVLFPQPDSPTKATFFPEGTKKFIPLRINF